MTHLLDFFAATSSPNTIEKLKEIPHEFWVKVGIGVAALIVVVIFLRKVAKVNKVVLAVIVLMIVSFTGFNWIYERNEPKWATPFVERVAHFFPTKDMYGKELKK